MVQFKEEILTNETICVHCSTEEQAKNLLEWMYSKGLRWRYRQPCYEDMGSTYQGHNTCYHVDGIITQSDVCWATTHGYTVFSYEEVIQTPTFQSSLDSIQANIVQLRELYLALDMVGNEKLANTISKIEQSLVESYHTIQKYELDTVRKMSDATFQSSKNLLDAALVGIKLGQTQTSPDVSKTEDNGSGE